MKEEGRGSKKKKEEGRGSKKEGRRRKEGGRKEEEEERRNEEDRKCTCHYINVPVNILYNLPAKYPRRCPPYLLSDQRLQHLYY